MGHHSKGHSPTQSRCDVFVASTTGIVALALITGCAATSQPAVARVAAPASPSSDSFVEQTATQEQDFPDKNSVLKPPPSSMRANVSAATAFAAIKSPLAAAVQGALSGEITAELFDYTNSAYGDIQPDGTVRTKYTDVPTWEFSAPLSHYVDQSQGGLGVPVPTGRTNCRYIYLVLASTGEPITWWQQCDGS